MPLRGRLQWAAGRRGITRQQARPVHAPVARPEMGQRKPIAGGFGRGLSAANLSQVPVVELVAVEKAQDLAPGAEADRPAEPLKGETAARLAAGPVVDLLGPAAKGFWHLELDQAVV